MSNCQEALQKNQRETPLNLEAVRKFRFEAVTHAYSRKDTILYALGLGYGANPADPSQLAFVYEDNLRTVPSICCVLAHPGMWVRNPALGIDWLKMLHGEQSFEIHNPIPPEGTVVGSYAIVAVEDKGAGKGAIRGAKCTDLPAQRRLQSDPRRSQSCH